MEAKASMIMGLAKHSAGRHVEALHHSRQAGLLYRHCDDTLGQAEAAVVLGKCQHGLWRYREASASLLYALTHARLSRDRTRQSHILSILSQVLADMGHYPKEALEHAEEALALSRMDQDATDSCASALGAICVAYAGMGKHEQAAQHAQDQLALCSRQQHVHGKERALWNLGRAQLALGRAEEGEHTFLVQRETAVLLGDIACEASALQGLRYNNFLKQMNIHQK